jgi:hypothetical protein
MRLLTLAALAALLLAGAPAPAALAPDYGLLDGALLRNVRNGVVDYAGLREDPAFGQFLSQLAVADEPGPGQRFERLALLINAYNALTLASVLEGQSMGTARQRRAFQRQPQALMGGEVTLAELEALLADMEEPRAAFALACAAVACPRLASRAYRPELLEQQLDAAARSFINDGTRNRFDAEYRIAFLALLWQEQAARHAGPDGTPAGFIAGYVADEDLAASLRAGGWDFRYPPADWLLNGYLAD